MGSNAGAQISNLTARITDLETQIVPVIDKIGQIDRLVHFLLFVLHIMNKEERNFSKISLIPVLSRQTKSFP
jgi:hypothetical protein